MIGVYRFSGTGHAAAVADFLGEQLGVPVTDISELPVGQMVTVPTAVVVFPVYCQNIPQPVAAFLQRMQTDWLVPVAVYGGFGSGHVLHDAAHLSKCRVSAAAIVPAGHTLLHEEVSFDRAALLPLVEKIRCPHPIALPRERKNPMADVFPAWRSRIGVRMHRGNVCHYCGRCEAVCPCGAIHTGHINSRCMRCMKCVAVCPAHALQFRCGRLVSLYLKLPRKTAVKVYC